VVKRIARNALNSALKSLAPKANVARNAKPLRSVYKKAFPNNGKAFPFVCISAFNL
jgi:hypothetical protein